MYYLNPIHYLNYENQSNFLTAHRFDNSKIKKNKEKNKQREKRKKKNPAEPCRTSMQPTSAALRDHPFSTYTKLSENSQAIDPALLWNYREKSGKTQIIQNLRAWSNFLGNCDLKFYVACSFVLILTSIRTFYFIKLNNSKVRKVFNYFL